MSQPQCPPLISQRSHILPGNSNIVAAVEVSLS